MASRMNAIAEYRPKVVQGKTVQMEELVELIAGRSGLNEGDIAMVLKEFSNALTFFSRGGRAVKLDSLGTFTPHVKLDGHIRLTYLLAPKIRKQLNLPGYFLGDIHNRDSIGMTADDLVERWNVEHPDDPVQ